MRTAGVDFDLAEWAPNMIIGDSVRSSGSGGSFDHVYPATGKAQVNVALAGTTEVDEAVAAARAGLAHWRRWAPARRRQALTELARVIRADVDRLATLQTLENGMPQLIARAVVNACADWIEYAAGWADKLHGMVVPTDPGHVFDYVINEPIGVVGVITPWNAPLGSIGMCVGPPLAAGCSVILKSSDLAPLSPPAFGRLCLEAGLPAGVVNVLTGGADVGAALVAHPGVNKISFTGGSHTGRKIAASCGESLKPVVLELGGKSANIVFEDASFPSAVRAAMAISMLSGQGCTVPSRLLVQESIADDFVGALAAAMGKVPVGDPLDPATVMGPVVNQAACDRILGMVDRARTDAGAKVVAGGERLGGDLADGYFIGPTLVTDVDNDSEIAREEVFGPVVSVITFGDEDDAIAIANDSQYGLAGYIQTQDLGRALRVSGALDVGNVGINGGHAPANEAAPFGGVKNSGYGKVGGLPGIMEFVVQKNVNISVGSSDAHF